MDSNISSNIVLWACAALTALGVCIMVRPLIDKLLSLILNLFSKRSRRRSIDSINEEDFELSYLESTSSNLSRILESKTFWGVIGLVLALFIWDKISSPVIFVLVYAVGSAYRIDRSIRGAARLDTQIDLLISSFRSRVVSCKSINLALEEMTPALPNGNLKKATEKVCRLLKSNKAFRQSFYPWLLFEHPMLSRFAFLLSSASGLTPSALEEILDTFQKNQQSWMQIREETRQGINSVSLLMKSLLSFAVAILAAVSLLPAWRAVLLERPLFYIGFLVSLVVMLGYTVIVQIEVRRLEAA